MTYYTHHTEIELCGETYPGEVFYEFDEDAYPIIYGVEMVKQTCQKGGIWYDESGRFHSGPHFIRMSITDLLTAEQIGLLADEICAAELENATDKEIERAHDKAIDRWQFSKSHGLENYPGVAIA